MLKLLIGLTIDGFWLGRLAASQSLLAFSRRTGCCNGRPSPVNDPVELRGLGIGPGLGLKATCFAHHATHPFACNEVFLLKKLPGACLPLGNCSLYDRLGSLSHKRNSQWLPDATLVGSQLCMYLLLAYVTACQGWLLLTGLLSASRVARFITNFSARPRGLGPVTVPPSAAQKWRAPHFCAMPSRCQRPLLLWAPLHWKSQGQVTQAQHHQQKVLLRFVFAFFSSESAGPFVAVACCSGVIARRWPSQETEQCSSKFNSLCKRSACQLHTPAQVSRGICLLSTRISAERRRSKSAPLKVAVPVFEWNVHGLSVFLLVFPGF